MTDKIKNYNELKGLALSEGMSLFGVADINPVKSTVLLDKKILKDLTAGISIGPGGGAHQSVIHRVSRGEDGRGGSRGAIQLGRPRLPGDVRLYGGCLFRRNHRPGAPEQYPGTAAVRLGQT